MPELPFIKICHRNGRVHLTVVRIGLLGLRESIVVRMSPELANTLADELRGKRPKSKAKPGKFKLVTE